MRYDFLTGNIEKCVGFSIYPTEILSSIEEFFTGI